MTHDIHSTKRKTGSITILILVFGLVFSTTIGGLVLLTATQHLSSVRTDAFERALTIAQAGAEYYQWHLAHDPLDYTDGTGLPGPYIHNLSDPYGNTEAVFSLSIDPPASGSSITTITSQGWINTHPEIKRTVKVKIGKPSIAEYAFLNNSNVWYGQKITIHGKIFSNGGIRMDGTHDSTVQSAKATYTCGSETGCSPPVSKPGVWGGGGPQELWQFPVAPKDFNSFSMDFNAIKDAAQQKGLYLGPSGSYGYHIVFRIDGTYEVYAITNADNARGWSVENGCENLYQTINNETLLGTYSISQKPVIFVEDNVWVEGTVNGMATVAAARFPIDLNSMNIWINNNILYAAKDGTNDLGLIAQNRIIFALDIPQDFEIDAALLAHKGQVIRHNYKYQGCSHKPEAVRQQLYIYGSIISNLKSYWSYGQGGAGFGSEPTSGFSQREIIYDPYLYFNPPPYFPVQGDYELISWEER